MDKSFYIPPEKSWILRNSETLTEDLISLFKCFKKISNLTQIHI